MKLTKAQVKELGLTEKQAIAAGNEIVDPKPKAQQFSSSEVKEQVKEKSKNLIEVSTFCEENGLPGKVSHRWVWIRFPKGHKRDKKMEAKMRAFGFKWNGKATKIKTKKGTMVAKARNAWSHDCGHKSKGINTKEMPWEKYGAIDCAAYNLQSAK